MVTADALSMSPIAAHTSTTPPHKSPQPTGYPKSPADSDSSLLSTCSHEIENKYSFTPNRLPPPKPRAWQRQPSQPYAPRHGAQKIWRRAPLRNLSDEVNRRWRRGSGEVGQSNDAIGDGVVRPAKRMKVVGQLDGKENEEIEMEVDRERYESWGRGLVDGAQEMLAIQHDGIADEAEPQEAGVLSADDKALDFGSTEVEIKIQHEESPSPADASGIGYQLDGPATEQLEELEQAEHPVPQHILPHPETEDGNDVSMASLSNVGVEFSVETSITGAEPTGDNRSDVYTDATSHIETNIEQPLQHEATETGSSPPKARSAALPEMCFDITSAPTEAIGGNISPSSTLETDQTQSSSSENTNAQAEILSAAETSSPLSDEAALSLGKQTITEDAQNNESLTTVSAPQPTRPHSQPEEDDTAFLQQFLQRAKQAREKNPALQLYRPVGEQVKRHLIDQQIQGASPQRNDRKRPRSPEPEDLSNLDNLEDATITATVLTPNPEDTTEKPSSPSRRSNRISANTKLPRPQRPTALPNTISLRRLNGTEFISMAKQRADAQSAASATRNNTRKNKGSALSVQDKLKQMDLGFGDQANNKDAPEPDRKQKQRVRKKTGVKYDRVAWAVKIARYQEDGEEHTLTVDGESQAPSQDAQGSESDDDDDVPPPPKAESDLSEEPKTASSSSATTPKKSTRSSSSRSGSKSSKSRSKAASEEPPSTEPATPSSNTATKRKRVATSGSSNGTPAPKRAMAALLETARENEGVAAALGRSRRASHAAAEAGIETEVEAETMAETRGSKRLRMRKGGE